MKKTYFLTDTLETQLPVDFVNSTNKRYIEVHPCYIERTQKDVDKMEKAILMHGDFVWRDAYIDHALCICNEWRTKYKKYEFRSNSDTMKLWFTDIAPIKTTTKEILGRDYVDSNKNPQLHTFDYEEALEYLKGKFPDKTDELDQMYHDIEVDGFNFNSNILYLSDIYPIWGVFYSAYHFIDHVTKLYNDRQEFQNVKTKETGPVEDKEKKIIEYTTITTYDDPNINRKIKETTTVTYRLIDDDYKFFAEFLLMY